MAVLLALTSAVVYGMADYCGGRASRRQPAAFVALLGQVFSVVLLMVVVLVDGTAVPAGGTWAWGAAGGAAGAIGLGAFYFALANGAMTVVAPLTAVVGAVLPVVVGIATGERPEALAYLGILLAIAAVALVSGAASRHTGRVRPLVLGAAIVAGLGFGLLFVALDRTDPDAGLWPLVAARCASVPLLLAVVVVLRARPAADRPSLRFAVVAGVFDMAANVAYLEAVRAGFLSVVAVISSLYPASTVALARLLDGERVNRWQRAGLVVAVVALVCITLGRA